MKVMSVQFREMMHEVLATHQAWKVSKVSLFQLISSLETRPLQKEKIPSSRIDSNLPITLKKSPWLNHHAQTSRPKISLTTTLNLTLLSFKSTQRSSMSFDQIAKNTQTQFTLLASSQSSWKLQEQRNSWPNWLLKATR